MLQGDFSTLVRFFCDRRFGPWTRDSELYILPVRMQAISHSTEGEACFFNDFVASYHLGFQIAGVLRVADDVAGWNQAVTLIIDYIKADFGIDNPTSVLCDGVVHEKPIRPFVLQQDDVRENAGAEQRLQLAFGLLLNVLNPLTIGVICYLMRNVSALINCEEHLCHPSSSSPLGNFNFGSQTAEVQGEIDFIFEWITRVLERFWPGAH